MSKQMQVPGTERKVVKAIADAAEAYVVERNKRIKLSAKEKESKEALIAVMRKNGETTYRDDDANPPVIITLTSKDNVKVTEISDDEGDGEEPKAKGVSNQYHQPWAKCPVCGLSEPGVHTLERCQRMQAGHSLGGKPYDAKKFDVDELPEPPAPDFKGEKPLPVVVQLDMPATAQCLWCYRVRPLVMLNAPMPEPGQESRFGTGRCSDDVEACDAAHVEAVKNGVGVGT